MVTDIHGWSVADEADQPHPVFSVQPILADSAQQSATQDHEPHCGVCSYDHGGHMGQTLAAVFYVAAYIPVQHAIEPPHATFWHSRNTSPGLRPPIA